MTRNLIGMVWISFVLACCGCVHVHQLIKMNHDGSGTLTERVKVLPRAVRLLKGRRARTGKAEDQFALLTEEALRKRAESFGEVTLKKKETRTLPDGSVEIESLFEFKDVNKVNLWMVPTFACSDPKRDGHWRLGYAQIIPMWGGGYCRADQINVHFDRPPTQQKSSSPSVLQKYRRVNPVFLDMLKDFRFEIQIEAPDDVETLDDIGGVVGMAVEKNRLTPYRVYGENAVMNSELIRAFITGEVGGNINAWGGDWRAMERGLPDTYTPCGSAYEGMSARFAKTAPVPDPNAKEEKK